MWHHVVFRRPARLCLELVCFGLLWRGPEAQSWCRLASLTLRFGDRPVDLVPAFSPTTFTYEATLEFGMDSFYVDSVAGVGCETDRAPISLLPVAAGGVKQLTIFAKDPKTDLHQAYNIRVSRMRGSETEVHSIQIDGARLDPSFNPEIRRYKAYLDIGKELATMAYILADSGQKVHCAADVQRLNGASKDENSAERRLLPDTSRRLAPTGEVQYRVHRQSFPIDVGFTRRLTLTVQSTDPEVRERGNYMVDVIRPGCPASRPLFDPASAACAVHCPSGFYPNPEASRCSKCNTNCAVCSNIMECKQCVRDTEDFTFTIAPNGGCMKHRNGLLARWMWWVTGLAAFAGLLMCAGFCLVCERIWACCCGSKKRPRYVESDSDVDG